MRRRTMLHIAKISVSWEDGSVFSGQSERSLAYVAASLWFRAASAQFYNTIASAGRVPAFGRHEIAEGAQYRHFAYNNGQ
jgi:hypothetical protein